MKREILGLLLIAVAILLGKARISGQTAPSSPARKLYLVAGTTTEHGDDSYPVTLYSVDDAKTLQLVREVVPQQDGVRFIYAYGNAIFLLHPHDRPTSVAVLHTDDPDQADDVAFSSTGVLGAYGALAEPPSSGLVLLISWITNMEAPGEAPPAHYSFVDVKVSVSPKARGLRRVQFDGWSDYRYLRCEGEVGGPEDNASGAASVGSAEAGRLMLHNYDHPVILDTLPPNLRSASPKTFFGIVAATQRYLILTHQFTFDEIRSGRLGNSSELYVHDRLKNRWETIETEGNMPIERLLGSWLAMIVADWNPRNRSNPGRENERAEKADILPPTQMLYHAGRGSDYSIPGILILENLADGRRIRIETDEEDSEILWADDESVLYRVNDEIYQAKIVGDKLQGKTMIVKDDDVPEVHWVFWSK